MLQEGEDYLTLKTLYNTEPVELFYKCYGMNETLLTTKVNTTIDSLPKTWDELFLQEPDILSNYQKVVQYNAQAPTPWYNKTMYVETHIKSADNIKLVYNNVK